MSTVARPNVILLCIDALRADAVRGGQALSGTHWAEIGAPRTPAIDGFLESAGLSATAVATSSWTKPSVPSLLMSCYPSEHGVLEVAKGDAVSSPSLPEERLTLAEVFREAGYRCFGIGHNAQLDPSLGFDRGFEVFDSDAGDGWRILEKLRELNPFAAGPAFLYVHLIEPHWPFGPRIRNRIPAAPSGVRDFGALDAGGWKRLKAELRSGEASLPAAEVRHLLATYKAAVEEADAVFGAFLAWLRDTGAEDAVVLLTADHGEELLDHGLVGHGQSLHEELIRVPFGLQVPGRVIPPLPDGTYVTHLDVVPTLLEVAGLSAPEHAAGRSLLRPVEPGAAFCEVKHKRRYHQAIYRGSWKLIRSYFFRGREEPGEDYNNLAELLRDRPFRCQRKLFDLARDPAERRDRFGDHPEIADELEMRLDAWWAERAVRQDGSGTERDLDAALIRRLEALGYL